jgi:hypothetical protein
MAAASQPAGAVLREQGVTPGRVEAEIVRLSGGGLFGDLDRDALATVGVDIDAVRATTEASFGQEALTRAARAVHRKPRWFDPRPAAFAGRGGAFLLLGPGAGQALQHARREAQARHATQPSGVEDLALGILAISEGLVPTDPDGTRRVRDCTERRNPGPLPPGKLTSQLSRDNEDCSICGPDLR